MKKQFTGNIITISDEADNIKKITIRLERKLSFIPGQYVMIAFTHDIHERRAFSIVSRSKNDISLYIKKKGQFTTQLLSCKPGKKLVVFGPFGTFVLPKEKRTVVFIAGGIGITPLYSMLHYAKNEHYSGVIQLFYATKRKTEMAFLKELQCITCNNINIRLFFTQEDRKKRISVETIENTVPEFKQSLFYLCGPVPMMNDLKNQLFSKGITDDQIKQEEFQ